MAAGNATANVLGQLILPLCGWLYIDYVLEQPAARPCFVLVHFWWSFFTCITGLVSSRIAFSNQGTSLLFQWPDIADFHASLGQAQDEGPYSDRPSLSMLRLNMSTFGGWSKKPLMLQGTWAGLHLLGQLQTAIERNLPERDLLTLTEQRGRWKTGIAQIK